MRILARAGEPSEATRIEDWGLLDYGTALRRQRRLWRQRALGAVRDTIAVVEHPPTVTLGRHAPEGDLRLPARELRARGIAVVRSDRGGRATVHAPGQAVVYPIVSLVRRNLGVEAYVRLLERAAAGLCRSYGLEAQTGVAGPGVWLYGGKVASIGLRISRGVAYHGIALNVEMDLSLFDVVVPCGVPNARVANLREVRPGLPPAARLGRELAERIAALLTELTP